MSDGSPLIVRVSSETIRRFFNTSQHHVRIANREYDEVITRNTHLSREKATEKDEPYCTHSQYVQYYDPNGAWMVGMHRYLRPDGRLGASGREDPKRVRLENTIYISS